MTRPRHSLGQLRKAPFLAGVWLLGALAPAHAQSRAVPLTSLLAEIQQTLAAKKPGDALALLDEFVQRARTGENLPAGVTLDRLLLVSANTHFQAGRLDRAAAVAAEAEAVPGLSAAQLGEARMVRGLALALQNQFADAAGAFRLAEDAPAFRDKALLYGAMSSAQAGDLPAAIAAYNRLLASAPRDRDWADAALALIDLHLRAGNLSDARRGLALLRGRQDQVDNFAGLNLLSLRLGDALVKSGDHAGAVAAYRAVSSLAAVRTGQAARFTTLERTLARLREVGGSSATETDTLRRLSARLDQAKTCLAEIEKLPDYDATLRLRLGTAFQERGGVWEAALLYEDLITRHPESPERETAYFNLVRAYADAGRFEKVRDAVARFTRAYPTSPHAPQALYLAALSAARRADASSQLAFLDLAVNGPSPSAELGEPMALLRAQALFTLGRHAEARDTAAACLRDHPTGKHAEDTRYLVAMADLAEGRAAEAETALAAHLRDYPTGKYHADARYRLAAAAYARQDNARCETLCQSWLTDFPAGHPQRGEVLSLLGDALAGSDRAAEAIAAYRQALDYPLSDEQLGYVLDEITRHHQTRREFDAAVELWENFAAERPDHPFVINAAYWISRIRAREGRSDEALELVGRIARRHVADPTRGDLERLLVELAATLARPPRAPAGTPKPPPAPEADLFARAEKLLLDDTTREQPAARARLWFTQSEIAAYRQEPARRDELLGRIASNFAPDQLPPGILGKVGDLLLAQGQNDLARSFYTELRTNHRTSLFADFACVGLGEIALRENRPDDALRLFTAAVDEAGSRFKLKESLLGRARALLALDRPDAARELFEQVAANRAWRGEATAEALYYLGEIQLRTGTPDSLAKAQAHYQRIYLSYKRHDAWVARAYLRSAETFEKLGQLREAVDTLNRMLYTEQRLKNRPDEWERAKTLYERLAPLVPAAPATAS